MAQSDMNSLAEKLKSKISAVSLLTSIATAWLIVPLVTGFPMVAFFVFFVCTGSLVFIMRKQKTWFDLVLYLGILALSLFTIFRANSFLQLFDLLFIIFFGSLLIRPLLEEHNLFTIVFSPLIVLKNSLLSKNMFPYVLNIPQKYGDRNLFREYIPTILVTTLVLVITIPLLASANPFFNSLLQNILNTLNLVWLFRYIFADSFQIYVVRIVFFALFAYLIPRMLTVSVQGAENNMPKLAVSVNYLYPKVAMAGLLIVFFITQLELYFASSETLRSMGYTNSRLTNEVFFQVTIVAFIVFLLAYFDKARNNWQRRLTYILILEAFFLICTAFKSVSDYSILNGFTHKRLWGYASMVWLTGILALFIFHYRNQTKQVRFVKQALTYTLGIILVINLVNFDYLIAHVSQPTVAGQVDYAYLSRLSPDAHYYQELLTKSVDEAEKDHFQDIGKNNVVYNILERIEFLKDKYGQRHDINTFNFSEYQEYQTVKNINTDTIRSKMTDIQQRYQPKNQSSNQ